VPPVKRGSLVVLEGLDGSGKTTQVAALAAALRAAGRDVVETREPTDGPIGRRIRAMAASGEHVAPEQELAWFLEDRREHVAAVVRPALAAGRVVVSDRYFLSTVAYQGARGLDWRAILADAEREFPLPDLALVLEIDPAAGLARARARGGRVEPVFETEAYLARVAAIFAAIERPWVERLDARGDAARVERAVRDAVRRRLGLGLA
jgi:dTMP kinase